MKWKRTKPVAPPRPAPSVARDRANVILRYWLLGEPDRVSEISFYRASAGDTLAATAMRDGLRAHGEFGADLVRREEKDHVL